MSIRVHNTQSGELEILTPVHPGEVRIYVCGPTVYDELHIGNFRCFVIFDTLARFLRQSGYQVTKVQNFTDVDDRTIASAKAEGISLRQLTDRYIDLYHRDAARLGIGEQIEPRATDYVPEMIAHIEQLIALGHAYAADGSVYFSVRSFAEYGQLSHQPADERQAGARVELEPGKQAPEDFALWKHEADPNFSWPSPWGPGRPGWHIECSVMSAHHLGVPFDIHGGGVDLLFPHHENEIAQSTPLAHESPARIWMHNGMLTMSGEKMSKSLKNTFRVSDLLDRYAPEAIRLFLLSAHYRSPLAAELEGLDQAKAALRRIENVLRRLRHVTLPAEQKEGWDRFLGCLADDFNTAEAQGVLFETVRGANTALDHGAKASALGRYLAGIEAMTELLGVTPQSTEVNTDDEIARLVAARESARQGRDFALADQFRQQLKELGVVVEDTAQGSRWYRA
ncbi:MAG: cysteine--tRNA ligase [Sulfobacillus sp.]